MPAVTAPAEAWNVSCSSGISTTSTPPPNGPRKPPRYSAARAIRSREALGAALTRRQGVEAAFRPTGCQTSGAGEVAREALETRRRVVAEADRGVGRDEQRRRRPRGRPGVARVVESVVDPRHRAVAGVPLDRAELPVSGARRHGEGEKRRSNGQAEDTDKVLVGLVLPSAAPDEVEQRREREEVLG